MPFKIDKGYKEWDVLGESAIHNSSKDVYLLDAAKSRSKASLIFPLSQLAFSSIASIGERI